MAAGDDILLVRGPRNDALRLRSPSSQFVATYDLLMTTYGVATYDLVATYYDLLMTTCGYLRPLSGPRT